MEPLPGRVAVVCVSNRPGMLSNVHENVARQRHPDIEFVFVSNWGITEGDELTRAVLGSLEREGTPVRFLERPPTVTLGACLNAALDATSARFAAKFDDDDRYGGDYLSDALRAHRYAGAGVVGKHTYFAHLVERDETWLRHPRNEFRYSSTLAGGTLVIDRERVGNLRFKDVSLGEDRAFLSDCHRRGISTFSADRFGYVQSRGDHNTWGIASEDFLDGCEPVGPGLRLDAIEL